MNIVSIIGPTGVGKSNAALSLAEHLLSGGNISGVDLISADSRQVYKGLEIISGADIPEDGESVSAGSEYDYPYFQLSDKVVLHGVAIIEPSDEWSLSHFYNLAHQVIEQADKQNRAVIVVGGTGLYQTRLLQSDLIENAPPNPEVRAKAESMSVAELQSWLGELDMDSLAALNESDRANPRRLIRAIERELWVPTADKQSFGEKLSQHIQHFFGLKTTKEDLELRVHDRVVARLENGAVGEAQALEATLAEGGVALSSIPAHTTCGLREALAYGSGEIDRATCVELWTKRELSYAKRQDTWWKKHTNITWFDVNEPDWKDSFLKQATTGILDTQNLL